MPTIAEKVAGFRRLPAERAHARACECRIAMDSSLCIRSARSAELRLVHPHTLGGRVSRS